MECEFATEPTAAPEDATNAECAIESAESPDSDAIELQAKLKALAKPHLWTSERHVAHLGGRARDGARSPGSGRWLPNDSRYAIRTAARLAYLEQHAVLIRAAIERLRPGWTYPQLARECGLTPWRVRRVIKATGMTRPKRGPRPKAKVSA